MTAPSTSCRDLEPEVVALARGELPPAEAAPLRAHVEGCSSCASLHADTLRVRAAAAARPAPVPGEASRARLRAVLDAAWEESLAEEEAEAARRRSRGPVLRLLDHAGRRYAESRAVRFLTFSVAIHAAAAVALTVHLVGGGGGSGDRRPLIEVSGTLELPPPYPEDPFTAPPVPEGGIAEGTPLPWIPDAGWPVPGSSFPGAEPTPVLQDPLDFSAAQRLYPNGEFSAFATARFRSDLRTRGLARAWGAEEATAVGRAVERSLAFLAGTQESDGTWPSGRPGDPGVQEHIQRDQGSGDQDIGDQQLDGVELHLSHASGAEVTLAVGLIERGRELHRLGFERGLGRRGRRRVSRRGLVVDPLSKERVALIQREDITLRFLAGIIDRRRHSVLPLFPSLPVDPTVFPASVDNDPGRIQEPTPEP